MKVAIIGAGHAGLLAANMLRNQADVTVFEAADALPDNHHALLRFRSEAVARVVNIPFERVEVTKMIMYHTGLYAVTNPMFNNMYSNKVTNGRMISKRSISDLSPVTRWIAPPNLSMLMSIGINIKFGKPFNYADLVDEGFQAIISTIPMSRMLVDYMSVKEADQIGCTFESYPVYTFTGRSDALNVHQTFYIPDTDTMAYRVSFVGNRIIAECTGPSEERAGTVLSRIVQTLTHLTPQQSSVYDASAKLQRLGKLVPIDEDVRRSYITMLTDEYHIYSLGKFATWRNILLDDVVHDVEMIMSMISSRSSYTRRLRAHK